jgi:drug/metabolite transporter (DMT)-like permease
VLEPWKLQGGGAIVGRPILGGALGAASAVCYAANVIVTKKMGTRFTSEEQLVWHSVVSAILLVVVAIVLRAPRPDVHGVELVALAGLVVGATAGLLFLYGLRRIPAEHAGMLCFLEPLTAVVVAWLVWGERPGTIAMAGGILVVTSGALTLASGRAMRDDGRATRDAQTPPGPHDKRHRARI